MKYSSNDVVTPEPRVVPGPEVPLDADTPDISKSIETPKPKKKLILPIILALLLLLVGAGITYFLLQSGVVDTKKTTSGNIEDNSDTEDGDAAEDDGGIAPKEGADKNVVRLTKLFTDPRFTKFKVTYPDDWNLSTKEISAEGKDFDDLEVTLNKNDMKLVFTLQPVAGIGAVGECFTYDKIDYTWIDSEYVRISTLSYKPDETYYHKGLVDREHSPADFDSAFADYEQFEPSAAGKKAEYEACGTLLHIIGGTPSTYKLDGSEVGALLTVKIVPKDKITAELTKEADQIVIGMEY